MRTVICLAIALAGCDGETGFQSIPDDNKTLPAGTLELSHSSVDYVDARQGIAESVSILATNVSEEHELRIEYGRLVDNGGGNFYTDEDANIGIRLNPGGTRDFVVVCSLLSEDAAVAGNFRFKTNDVDHQVVDIPLCCMPAGFTGCDAEDSGGS